MIYQNKIIYFHWNKSSGSSFCVRSIHKSTKSMRNFPLTFRILSQSTGKWNVLNTQATFVLQKQKKQNLQLWRQWRRKVIFGAHLGHNSADDSLKSWISLERINQMRRISGASSPVAMYSNIQFALENRIKVLSGATCFFFLQTTFLYLFWIVINQSNGEGKKKTKPQPRNGISVNKHAISRLTSLLFLYFFPPWPNGIPASTEHTTAPASALWSFKKCTATLEVSVNLAVVELKCTWCLVHLNLSWIICQELSMDEDSIWEVMCLDMFRCLSIIGILRNLVLSWYLKNNVNKIRFQIHKKYLTQSQMREMYRCLLLIISKTTPSLYISSFCSFEKRGGGRMLFD